VAAGDQALGHYFLEAIHPFLWRRSLDFGALEELQSISRRIRDHYSDGQIFGPGFDLKRGRGGIREIEFYAQIHQLIHGGRDPSLRAPATLDALSLLAEAKRIPQEVAATLADPYRLYRTIEHRLQMVDDRQTHSLPSDRAALDNVARLHGLSDGEALMALLQPHVEAVEAIYGSLTLGDGEGLLPRTPEALEARLTQAGFEDAAAARLRIESWRSGTARSLRAPASAEAFEAMLPALIDSFGASPDGMRAINRFDDVVTRLPSGVNFYRLLQARPGLTQILATVLSHAPALAEQLGRRPSCSTDLLTPPPLHRPPPWKIWRRSSPAPNGKGRIIRPCSTGSAAGSTSGGSRLGAADHGPQRSPRSRFGLCPGRRSRDPGARGRRDCRVRAVARRVPGRSSS
jgi:glutamate-ammonia-ligase adenylyltransferase